MNAKLISLNRNYSTTRLLSQREPEIVNEPGDKVKTMLFLPPHPERKGEGGLRKKGYFKYSYEIENGRWYACNFRGRRLFEVKPAEGFEINLEEFKCKDGIVRLPLITVITVVLNGKEHLEKTIQSVINQTYPNVEYIVIDGGSTDGTVDIIKKYDDYIDYWVSEPDRGIYDAMNKGIELVSGLWINFMNAGDTFAQTDIIEKVFENSKVFSADVVYGDVVVDYHEFEKVVRAKPIKTLNREMAFSHQSAFIRTSVHKNRKFNLNYKIAADYNFFYNLWKTGHSFFYLSLIISKVVVGGVAYRKRLKVLNEYWQISGNNSLIIVILKEFSKGIIKSLLPDILVKEIIKKRKK